MQSGNFFAELKRRNVYRVAVAYAVVAWLLIQLASILFPTFEAPPWVMKVFIAAVALGFPLALILAWAFELTPEGIQRTSGSPETALPAKRVRRGLFWSLVAVGAAAALLLGFYFLRPPTAPVFTKTDAAAGETRSCRAALRELERGQGERLLRRRNAG